MSARGRLAAVSYRWLWQSLDWLYPPRCGGCNCKGSRWCEKCQRDVSLIRPPFCRTCGQPIAHTGLCHLCRQNTPQFKALRSWAAFQGPVKNALHGLKYRRDIALGEILSRHLTALYLQQGWQVDLVMPVPLGAARWRERGYNQAALLARPLALRFELDYHPQALVQMRDTPTQVGLSLDQRWINVAGSFGANPRFVRHKKVLIVDDVATSGATLSACSQALLDAGAVEVYALTLARAL